MEFENDYAQRMPMGRVAQVGALVLVVMIVLFVVFWNPTPPAPADVAKQPAAGESSGGGYTFGDAPDSNVSAVIVSDTPPGAPMPPAVPPSTNVSSAPPVVDSGTPPVPMPPNVAPSEPVAAPRPPAGPSRFHEITDEDTLYRLAQRYYGSQSGAALIIKANRLAPPYRLPIGMKLVIPAKDSAATSPIAAPPRDPEAAVVAAGPAPAGAVFHTVQQGDSLYKISKQYFGNQGGLARIKEANRLTSDAIRVGQKLVIPGVGADAPVPATQAPHE